MSDNGNQKHINDLNGIKAHESHTLEYWLISVLAFFWSAFQLYVVIFPINGIIARSIHISIAIFLVFLIYPVFAKYKHKKDYTVYIFAIIAAGAFLYTTICYTSIANRPGEYITIDYIAGFVAIILLLEAGRRSLGFALPLIAVILMVYCYMGPSLPDIISHRPASIERIISHMYLTSEGIFGVPLGVSTSFVFLFVLFGALLEKAGAGEYFINVAYSLLGKYRGGPAKASVIASGLNGMISGSSIANTVTTGTFTIPLMKKVGFTPVKAAAIEVGASTNGQLMPPIMGAAAFIMAQFLGVSYLSIIAAAAIPAFAAYFTLLYIVHLEAIKLDLKPMPKEMIPPKWETFKNGIHFIIPIIVLIYTLAVLQESPAKSAFNATISIIVIMLIQDPIKKLIKKEKVVLSDYYNGVLSIISGFITGAKNMIPIALATGLAGIIVGAVSLTGLGQVLTDLVRELSSGNILLILIFTAVASLLLGMGLPTTANYIVMASLTAPVILNLGIESGYVVPAIVAHLFVFYFGILADDTPPVGLAAYAGAAIAKADPIKTGMQSFGYDIRTCILPFAFFFNTNIILLNGADANNVFDSHKWVWITNPLTIVGILISVFIGMICFANATQGYFLKKLNIASRAIFLILSAVFLVPNIFVKYIPVLSSEYVLYIIGIVVIAIIFFIQKNSTKRAMAS